MDRQMLVDVLRKLRFSQALPEVVLEQLAESAELHGFPSGTTIFREGHQNDRLMVLTLGRVALDMAVPGRGDVRILSLGPGDMLAWSALLGGGKMTTSATALEDSQVVALPAGEVLKACDANPVLGYHVMRQLAMSLADRLVATRLQMLDLFGAPWEPSQQGGSLDAANVSR